MDKKFSAGLFTATHMTNIFIDNKNIWTNNKTSVEMLFTVGPMTIQEIKQYFELVSIQLKCLANEGTVCKAEIFFY